MTNLDFEADDLAPARGIFNAILIEFAAFLGLIAIWIFWWAALPGITT